MIKNLLNKSRYIDSKSSATTLRVDLCGNKKEIMNSQFNDEVNEYFIYLDERRKSTKLRLTSQVNIIASNILYNHITEVVKNEESSKAECLNFKPKTISTSHGKPEKQWGSDDEHLDDTQITYSGDVEKNYKYFCGIDILTNHILRSKSSFSSYIKPNEINPNFNTINDFIRDVNGKKPISHLYIDSQYSRDMNLYNKQNFMTFQESLVKNIVDKNGWLGFINKSKMEVYNNNNKNLGISRVINNEPANSFISFYPYKEHFSMIPHYNKSRHREEKNWEYCLTYPFSATTQDIPCIEPTLKSLKIAFIDETENDDDGLGKTVIYSSCKHGLMPDDLVNIYRSNIDGTKSELIEGNVVVDTVIDEYTFSVFLNDDICDNWISVFDEELLSEYGLKYLSGSSVCYNSNKNEYFYPVNNYVNADFDTTDKIGSQRLSFARVVENEQCEYYVRIFSRFPNFEFMNDEVTEETVYSNQVGITNAQIYANPKYEKQSMVNKLAFAKNIYGDDLSQITYIDDIDFDIIKDNLGRPLSSLYLTFVKTNYGRKEWYDGNVGDESVEFSHCFGKVNCGLLLSPHIVDDRYNFGNVRTMNNVDKTYGLNIAGVLRGHQDRYDTDEIVFNQQICFYGDLCEYSTITCNERTLDIVYNRFNTMQRELAGSSASMRDKFNDIAYENIDVDNFFNGYFSTIYSIFDRNPTSQKEGYYYQAHYEIPIRSFSPHISEFIPKFNRVIKLEKTFEDKYILITNDDNYVNLDDDIRLYTIDEHKEIVCDVLNILDTNKLLCNFKSLDGKPINIDVNTINLDNYRVYRKASDIPSYATMQEDGSGRYRWRDIVPNGFEESDGIIEEYPFTNGCFYINKQINIFVRRQDPFGLFGLQIPYNISVPLIMGIKSPIENGTDAGADDSINENEAIC